MRLRQEIKLALQTKLASLFFDLMPIYISILFGKFGFTRNIKKDPNVVFIGNNYKGKYKLWVHGDRFIEKEAASNFLSPFNPIRALSEINFNDAIVIDVGANVGTIAIYILEKGASKIFAFEPGPLYSDLKKNIDLNNINEKILPINLGLSDQKQAMYWAEDQKNRGNAHLINNLHELNLSKQKTKFGDKDSLVKVEVSTLDNFFLKNDILEKLDFIKIDVEGLEWKVIKGGVNLIKKFKPIVIAETHRLTSDMYGYDCVTPLFQFFYELGYESYSLNEKGNIEKFIYPNFKMDTLFIPKNYPLLSTKN